MQTFFQVKTSDLKIYLAQKREEGFTVLAAEQTTNSVPLESFEFPDKCILLMGEEKEGVPVELIRFVDTPIEISQLGRVRSLNVHVTAALFIYRFAAQKYLTVKQKCHSVL
jgi:tRNA G18 (ribose-2'-O)-methylase SpoU